MQYPQILWDIDVTVIPNAVDVNRFNPGIDK